MLDGVVTVVCALPTKILGTERYPRRLRPQLGSNCPASVLVSILLDWACVCEWQVLREHIGRAWRQCRRILRGHVTFLDLKMVECQ
jgi:hypothetical protein